MKTKSIYITLIMLLAFSTVAMAASVTPYVIDQVPGGAEAECAAVGEYMYAYKIDLGNPAGVWNASFLDGHFNTITVTNTTENSFDWSATNSIGAVLVKASTIINVYKYDPQVKSDIDVTTADKYAISHVTFCWNLDPVVYEGEWCSPGYWRQPQHLDSWAVTDFSPDGLFYDALGYYPPVSKLGVAYGAETNPTLLQVLQFPQYYGGDAFNAVGDLLSGSHPDVNFLGIRVEDSCPLN